MSKKLLSEAQVRRFQTLATIKPLSEMNYNEEAESEAFDNEESEEMAPEAPEAIETDFDAEEDDKSDADDTDVEIDEEMVEKFMDAVATIQDMASALGGATEEAPEMELETDDAEEATEMELDMDDAAEAPEMEEEEDMLEEALKGISYTPSKKEIVKEVAKRVAARLQEAKKAQSRLDRALGKK